MLKGLLSLVTPNSKDKKRKRSSAGLSVRTAPVAETSFFSDADVSNLNETSVTLPLGEGLANTSMISTERLLADMSFSRAERKSRTTSFDFCLTDYPKDVVVHRRSLQPTTPTPNASDAEHSFIENIFDSPGQRNRMHSMIGEKIYEAGNGSPQKDLQTVSKKL